MQKVVTTSVTTVEIPVSGLEKGMYVSGLDIPWLQSPFLYQGFEIESKDQIDELQALCNYVLVDVRKSTNKNAPLPDTYAVPVEEELEAANGIRDTTKDMVKRLFHEIELGKELDGHAVRETVTETVNSVLRNPNALMLLSQIKNKDEYTAEHSMNVSILTAAFARHLRMPRNQIDELAFCGLLHDVGKIRVPDSVLNKEGKFTKTELAVMRKHTTHGRQILLASNGIAMPALDVAFSHHERLDGQGYPRGLPKEHIPQYAKIVALADAYDAMTSTRVYHKARSPFEALTILFENRGSQFDTKLAETFIEFVGVYPAGSIVELSNGEVGIVLSVHPSRKLQPRIIVVRDPQKQACTERVIDLRWDASDFAGNKYVIKQTHPDGSFGISLKAYMDRGLRIEVPGSEAVA